MTVYHHFLIIHSMFFVLSIFLILKKTSPNNFVGIRIGKALWNEKNWYKVHTFTGWSMLVTSILAFIYLITLMLLKSNMAPELHVNTLYTYGGLFFLITGDAAIPAIYSFMMPESEKE